MPSSAATHKWKFRRLGGLDQVVLQTAEDLRALDQLDQKLWVALSCPVKGLHLDPQTLTLVDANQDGHIHAPEVIEAAKWAATRLKSPADLLHDNTDLPLAAINDTTPEGRMLVTAAKRVLQSLGRGEATAISVEVVTDTAKIFSATPLNGDGIVGPEAADDADAKALIEAVIGCVGGVPDRNGRPGLTEEKLKAFRQELADYVVWLDEGVSKGVAFLGEAATTAAYGPFTTVKAKVDDYFARCRLVAFDARAAGAMNRDEADFAAIAQQPLNAQAAEAAGWPIAHIAAERPLPLSAGVNPAWAQPLAELQQKTITPIFGAGRMTLTDAEWRTLSEKFAPYEAWVKRKPGTACSGLAPDVARAFSNGRGSAALEALLAKDRKLAPEFGAISDVERLARYYRDLGRLLRSFVNFFDFYSKDRLATFQAGTLFLDSRSTELCVRIEDPAAHALLAEKSKLYLAYLECERKDEKMHVVASFTQGDADYLYVGRNGLFYDREGRDWDAKIARVIENPISLREAFFSPYKRLVKFVGEEAAKRAAAADNSVMGKLTTAPAATVASAVAPGAPVAGAPAKPGPRKIDIGTVAALGVAVGALGTAFATLSTGLARLAPWQVPLAILVVLLMISTPSVVMAWIKLHQRTLGPVLEANGWAINGRVKINKLLGRLLTDRAHLPPGATCSRDDPFVDKKAKYWSFTILLLLLAGAAWFAAREQTWPFNG